MSKKVVLKGGDGVTVTLEKKTAKKTNMDPGPAVGKAAPKREAGPVGKAIESPPEPGIGHNSGETGNVGGVAGKRLLSFIERIERLEEEKAALAEDIKDIFAEAKGTGFETRIIRRVLRTRKQDIQKRREEEELFDLYMAAIGCS